MPRVFPLILLLLLCACAKSGGSSGPVIPEAQPDPAPQDPEGLWVAPTENSTEYKVLVILACFDGASSVAPCLVANPVDQPSSSSFPVTGPQDAEKVFFDERFPGPWKRETVNDWFREVSNDHIRLSGEAHGIYHLAGPPPSQVSDLFELRDELMAMVAAEGVDIGNYLAGGGLGNFDRVVIAVPSLPGYAGIAFPPFAFVTVLDPGLIAHELGHTLGLGHAHGVICPDAYWNQNLLCPELSYSEYGNLLSVMGSSMRGHYDAAQKLKLGWIDPSQILDVDQSGQYEVTPLESRDGLKALRFSSTFGIDFYLEFRRPVGFDKYDPQFFAQLGPGLLSMEGAFWEYALEPLYLNDTSLMVLGTNPLGPIFGLFNPVLPLGVPHSEPNFGIQITPLSIQGSGATAKLLVDVQMIPGGAIALPIAIGKAPESGDPQTVVGNSPLCGGSLRDQSPRKR